jgi:alpha-tubulin suppressor-like RCC1 family protein
VGLGVKLAVTFLFTNRWNGHGQLGASLPETQPSPQKIDLANVTIKSIVAGKYAHSLLVSEEGQLYSWGWNENGQLGYSIYSVLLSNMFKIWGY